MMSVTRCTPGDDLGHGLPASCTRRAPVSTRSTLAPISVLISRARRAALARPAHLAGHHREAAALFAGTRGSTAAFSARMLVWNAMPSMVPMMSAIFFCWR